MIMNLTPRLQSLAWQLEKAELLIDVGADHAYLAIYAVQNKIAAKAIALDINQDPLLMAKRNVIAFGLESEIECRHSDGLKEADMTEIEAVVIAGMGGNTIKKIVEDSFDKAKRAKFLLLQPNNGEENLRKFLNKTGFRTLAQGVIKEKNHFYQWLKVEYDGQIRKFEGFQEAYGNPLDHEDKAETRVWINWEINRIKKILVNLEKSKKPSLKSEKLKKILIQLEELEKELTSFID